VSNTEAGGRHCTLLAYSHCMVVSSLGISSVGKRILQFLGTKTSAPSAAACASRALQASCVSRMSRASLSQSRETLRGMPFKSDMYFTAWNGTLFDKINFYVIFTRGQWQLDLSLPTVLLSFGNWNPLSSQSDKVRNRVV
jgi:hypothetical protein